MLGVGLFVVYLVEKKMNDYFLTKYLSCKHELSDYNLYALRNKKYYYFIVCIL